MADPADLVTLPYAQAALPDLAASADLAPLVTSASKAIARRCDRALAPTSFVEVHAPGRAMAIELRQYPVISLGPVMLSASPALTLANTLAAASRASVTTTATGAPTALVATGVVLAWTVAGVASTRSYAFATYPTVGALAAQVVADLSASGWTAVVASGMAGWATADLLVELGSRGALKSGAVLYAFADEVHDYALDPESGRLVLGGSVPASPPAWAWAFDTFRFPDQAWGAAPRFGGVRVAYTAGYSPVPDDLQRATVKLVRAMAQGGQSGAIRSYAFGQTKVEYAPMADGAIGVVEADIAGYRRRRFA